MNELNENTAEQQTYDLYTDDISMSAVIDDDGRLRILSTYTEFELIDTADPCEVPFYIRATEPGKSAIYSIDIVAHSRAGEELIKRGLVRTKEGRVITFSDMPPVARLILMGHPRMFPNWLFFDSFPSSERALAFAETVEAKYGLGRWCTCIEPKSESLHPPLVQIFRWRENDADDGLIDHEVRDSVKALAEQFGGTFLGWESRAVE